MHRNINILWFEQTVRSYHRTCFSNSIWNHLYTLFSFEIFTKRNEFSDKFTKMNGRKRDITYTSDSKDKAQINVKLKDEAVPVLKQRTLTSAPYGGTVKPVTHFPVHFLSSYRPMLLFSSFVASPIFFICIMYTQCAFSGQPFFIWYWYIICLTPSSFITLTRSCDVANLLYVLINCKACYKRNCVPIPKWKI